MNILITTTNPKTKKKLLPLFFLFLTLHLTTQAQTITKLDGSKTTAAALDKQIQALIEAADVAGLAETVFNNNKPIYKKTFGYKRLDTKETINTNANIYGAQLRKEVFAVLVMKLVEEGVLDLDKPLQSYLPKQRYTKLQSHPHVSPFVASFNYQ